MNIKYNASENNKKKGKSLIGKVVDVKKTKNRPTLAQSITLMVIYNNILNITCF